MKRISEQELEHLLVKHQQCPSDLDIINRIAIGYFQNPSKKTDKEDYDFFEKAYLLQKTVKSTHNFAWFLYFEWSEIEWRWNQQQAEANALKIQKECIDLNPQSYYPFCQMAYMLLDNNHYKDALKYFKIAASKASNRAVIHNLGCCYFQLGQYKAAKDCFQTAHQNEDSEHRSLFNWALTELQLNNREAVFSIVKQLQHPAPEVDRLMDYEIGIILMALDAEEASADWTLQLGLNRIDLIEWEALAFAVFKQKRSVFDKVLYDSLNERKTWMKQIKEYHPDWTFSTETAKKERISALEQEIEYRENIVTEFRQQPMIDINKMLVVEPIYCMLFDCQLHGNPTDDTAL